jgi:hypothetical protein
MALAVVIVYHGDTEKTFSNPLRRGDAEGKKKVKTGE